MPLSFSLDHIGPLARSVRDAAMILQAIAGHDPRDSTTVDEPVPDFTASLEDGVKGLRLAVPEEKALGEIDPGVMKAFRASIDTYRRMGAEIVTGRIPDLDRANRLTTIVIACEAAAYHAKWLRERPQDYGPQTRARLMPGLFHPATRYLETLAARGPFLAEFAEGVFTRADALIMPTCPMAVPTIAETDAGGDPQAMQKVLAVARFTRMGNFLGLPAISVPCGRDGNGMPIGLQVIGRSFDEATICRIARALERERGSEAAARPQL
jgi:aspartyl-tRNA(Asn)/glutamyl-tRNA(Gln) amidotransferase subunit A